MPLPNLCLNLPDLSYLGFAFPSIVRCKYTLYLPRISFGNDALIAYGNEEDIHTRPLLAKVGNELLNISEIKAVFVVGRIDKDKIAISARSKTGINVQLIMEKLGGGGHFSMAACQVEEKSIKETINKLEEAIDQYLDERG
mgnify:CR=1 FL=1